MESLNVKFTLKEWCSIRVFKCYRCWNLKSEISFVTHASKIWILSNNPNYKKLWTLWKKGVNHFWQSASTKFWKTFISNCLILNYESKDFHLSNMQPGLKLQLTWRTSPVEYHGKELRPLKVLHVLHCVVAFSGIIWECYCAQILRLITKLIVKFSFVQAFTITCLHRLFSPLYLFFRSQV